MQGDSHTKDSFFGILKENSRFWPNMAFTGYFILVFAKVFYPDFPYLIIVFYGLCLFFTQILYLLTVHHKLVLIVFIYFLFGSLIVAFGDGTMLTPISVLSHVGLFAILIRYKINTNIIRLSLCIYAVYCTYQSVYLGTNLNELAGGSRNLLGWIGLGLGIVYYTARYKNGEKIDIFTSIIMLFVALVCIGRGNIIGSVGAFIVIFVGQYKRYKLSKKVLFILSVIGMFGFIAFTFSEFIGDRISYFENKGFESNERAMVLDAYMNKIELETFFFGVSPDQYPFTILNGNFHNSFLLGHSNFGLLFIFFVIFLLYSFFHKGLNMLFLKCLLFILCLRSFTDTILFTGYFDFVYIYILFAVYRKNPLPEMKPNQ